MKKMLLSFVSLVLVASFFIEPVFAKVLPRFQKSGKSVGAAASKSIGISVRLRADRKAVNVYFSNLQVATAITYTLTYKTDGKDEGASGSLDVSSGTASREVLFGTCSSGVCRYHSNITNARLEVVTELLSGKKSIKRFNIRV